MRSDVVVRVWLFLVFLAIADTQTSLIQATPGQRRQAAAAAAAARGRSSRASATSSSERPTTIRQDISIDDVDIVDDDEPRFGQIDDRNNFVELRNSMMAAHRQDRRSSVDGGNNDDDESSSNVVVFGTPESPEVMILGTVDGSIHGVRVEDGEKLWSSDEVGGPTIKSFQAPSFKGGVVPGDDGLLYLFSEEADLSLHHLSIPDLVNSCPLTDTLGDEEDEIRVVGQRKTSYFELDPNTGRRLRVFTSDTGSLLNGRWEDVGSNQPPPEFGKKELPFPDSSPITIGRVDYHVRAFNAASGLEVWNFTYGQFLSRDRNVPRLDSNTLEIDTAVAGRATWEGVPVTAVFGVSRSNEKNWRFVSEMSLANEGQQVIGNLPDAKPIYLQRIKFKNGHVQVYATTNRPGRDIRCSSEVFPEDIDFRRNYGVGVPADQEQCTHIDQDFPLQGPYHVTNQHLLLDDGPASELDDPGSRRRKQPQTRWPGLPAHLPSHGLPGPEAEEQLPSPFDNEHFDASSIPFSNFSPGPQDGGQIRNLQAVIMALILLVIFLTAGFFWRSNKYKRRGGNELEVEYDPITETERVGQITVHSTSVLGRGCHGTTVLKGKLRDRPVAVKKVVASQFKLAKKEIDLLIRSDGHSNVVRYFTQEETREFIYLALELCDYTLETAVSHLKDLNRGRRELVNKSAKKNVRLPESTITFLQSLADATKHLHTLCIVHCDIKPQNILVIETRNISEAKREVEDGVWDPINPSGGAEPSTELTRSTSSGGSSYLAGLGEFYEAKLSDMGLGRKFSGTTSSIYGGTSMHGSGTVGWRAPELLSSLRSKGATELERDVAIRCGRKVDVFSMGCVFFYVVSNGFHPFGDAFEREKNIMEDNPVNLDRIRNYPEAQDLIGQMVRHNPQSRPNIEECMEHPLLWSAARKMDFLKHVSDRLELDRIEDRVSGEPRPFSVPESTLHEKFEEQAKEVFGSQGWLQRLHPDLRTDVVESKRRYYTTHSLRDLLRYMRNKYSHIRESSPKVRDLLSPLPERFLDEFIGSNRFPRLLIVCHRLVLEHCAHEPEFAEILGAFTVAKHGPEAASRAEEAKAFTMRSSSTEVKDQLQSQQSINSTVSSSSSMSHGTSSPQKKTQSLSQDMLEDSRPFKVRSQCVMDSLDQEGLPPLASQSNKASQSLSSTTSSSMLEPLRAPSPALGATSHLTSGQNHSVLRPSVQPPPGFEAFANTTSEAPSGIHQALHAPLTSSEASIAPPQIAPAHLFNRERTAQPGGRESSPMRSASPVRLSSSPNKATAGVSPFGTGIRTPSDNWRGGGTSKPPLSSSPHTASLGGSSTPPQPPSGRKSSKKKSRYSGDPKLDPHYKTVLCKNWENSMGEHCRMGDRCFYAHGNDELRPKLDLS